MLFRIYATLIVACVALFGVNLSSIVSTQESDNIKLVMNFDKTFDGTIEQNQTTKGLLLTISNLNVEQRKDFTFENSFIQKAVLAKIAQNQAVLFIETTNPINTNIVKTTDGQKITVVATQKAVPRADIEAVEPMKDNTWDILGWRYAVVIVFMIVLIVILLIVKKKMLGNPQGTISNMLSKVQSDELKIVTQRFIDNTNKLVLLEYEDAKYLILVGNSSMVIDKFYDNVSDITDTDFQKALAFTQVTNNEKQSVKAKMSDFEEYRLRAEGEF